MKEPDHCAAGLDEAGVGMFSFGTDKQTARVAGEFYVNAINRKRRSRPASTVVIKRSAAFIVPIGQTGKAPEAAEGPTGR